MILIMNTLIAKQLYINEDKEHSFYGGDQGWFTSNTRAMGGCSSIAAANSLRALCRKDKELCSKILSSPNVPRPVKNALCSDVPTKEDYSIFMTGVYNTIGTGEIFPLNKLYDKGARGRKPFHIFRPTLGRSSIGFIFGIIRFARKFNMNIKVNALTTAFIDSTKAHDFIEKGLHTSGAVVMLTSYNKMSLKLLPSNCKLDDIDNSPCTNTVTQNHFTTITGMKDDRLLISTWGKAAIASFTEISKSWHSYKAYESTLFYIEACSRSESNKCIKKCMIPFIKAFIATIIRHNIEKELN